VSEDPRSRRIAVIADPLLSARLDELRDGGWGAMQLPPADVDPATARDWVELTAEQVAEYLRTGYEVVLLDDGTWGEELEAALAVLRRRFAQPPAHDRDRDRALSLLVRKGYELELAYDAVRAFERDAA